MKHIFGDLLAGRYMTRIRQAVETSPRSSGEKPMEKYLVEICDRELAGVGWERLMRESWF